MKYKKHMSSEANALSFMYCHRSAQDMANVFYKNFILSLGPLLQSRGYASTPFFPKYKSFCSSLRFSLTFTSMIQ